MLSCVGLWADVMLPRTIVDSHAKIDGQYVLCGTITTMVCTLITASSFLWHHHLLSCVPFVQDAAVM